LLRDFNGTFPALHNGRKPNGKTNRGETRRWNIITRTKAR
jgi:hypothetical protein